MVKIHRILLYWILLTSIVVAQSSGQDSSHINDIFSIQPKYLLPQSRSDIQYQNFNVYYNRQVPKNRYNYTPDHLHQNPFGPDIRYSSFYTTRLVSDELNTMMHRPKDNAFVPVLGVAYIAMQMVSKYLLVKSELRIKPENILNCDSQLPIIEALWSDSPQTCKELYQLEHFNQKYTYKELESDINILVDQNLVKVKRLENEEIQYFPALDRSALHTTLETGRKDSLFTISQINQIDSLLICFGNPAR